MIQEETDLVDLQRHYADLNGLFEHPGWERLIKQATAIREAYGDITRIETADRLWFARGHVALCDWLLNIREAHHLAEAEIFGSPDA